MPTPIVGTTTTQLNVRPSPLSSSTPLGVINAATTVQIVAKDPGGNWYQILYEGGPERRGWVVSEYVSVENAGAIPVAGGSSAAPAGVVREQLNVRDGPGTDFRSVGTLKARDVVTLTGKDSSGMWIQIDFQAGPGGKGWVASSFIEASSIDGLPIVAASGEIVGTSTPTGIAPTPTVAVVAAREDGDSLSSPAVSVVFSPSGTGSLLYSSDVSSPEGDEADWISLMPYGSAVDFGLTCRGSGTLNVQLHLDGAPVAEGEALRCGETSHLKLGAGEQYTLRLAAAASSGLTYVRYTIRIYGGLVP